MMNEPGVLYLIPHSHPIAPFSMDNAANTFIRQRFDEERSFVYIPHMWWPDSDGYGGPVPPDPATLYVVLPLGEYVDQPVVFSITLASVLADLVDALMSPVKKTVIDPDGRAILREVADRMRQLADWLDGSTKS